ncbi:UDP-glucose 4-epimerase [Roseivirga ehrenbergii]|uniref:UDP-glucose 4-epimerase n=1 Tax=Roseivirga ehrenbergii (strain DSM 102268 / JCM 13514 / KCTC 12282 / NCIMB 14502 / KMM 6017) TaxID=279360 RepID=A0A150XBZ7_ROSEK|nr:UDP-glucose 4-epimerase GalE [Roseivirga ehrenbergii]KYG76216.1 UDP-glucose 4-epimerase [Roseivirga ehrenbergii]TCL00256.1 UDP-glucose 4-epimerase [Roseivirga ehrenbergii]
MQNILVTGGAGYIGSHTVVELHNAGYNPIIVDNLSNSRKSVLTGLKNITGKDFTFYQIDCNDRNAFRQVFKSHDISGVIHFAAYKAVGESVAKPLEYYENNVGSLMTLIRLMKEEGVEKLIFSSSCTVYGQPDQLPVTEQSPKKTAESPYGNTKQVCEEIIEDTSISDKSFRAIALRYFNPVGAHPSSEIGELPLGVPNNLVPFITQTAAGWREQLTVFGDNYDTEDGSCIRDYIHVVDLAKAHVKSLEYLTKHANLSFDIFNIGTGKGNTVLEIVNTFEEISGVKLNYRIGERRSGDIEKIYADVTKSSETLGWKTEKSLKDSLKDSWNWQKTLKKDI